MQEVIRVNLMGGIGNQLFQFFAAKSYADKFDATVSLNLGGLHNHRVNHGFDISGFNIEDYGNVKFSFDSVNQSTRRKIVRKIRKQSETLNNLCNKFGRDLEIHEIGYKPISTRHWAHTSMQGYFQTYKYFDEVVERQKVNLVLKRKSNWFKEKWLEISSINPIAVHYRRGDYVNEKNKIGLLSDEFFERGLKEALLNHPNREVWVFSDDIESARRNLTRRIDADISFVSNPENTFPGEEMFLMSTCETLLISNSTFSWWSGKLGPEPKKIFYPANWYRNLPTPNHLVPQSWNPVSSIWEV